MIASEQMAEAITHILQRSESGDENDHYSDTFSDDFVTARIALADFKREPCNTCGHSRDDHTSKLGVGTCWNGSGNNNTCQCPQFTPLKAAIDTKLICRAVNSHRPLIKALEGLIADWERVHDTIPADHEAKVAIEKAEAGSVPVGGIILCAMIAAELILFAGFVGSWVGAW